MTTNTLISNLRNRITPFFAHTVGTCSNDLRLCIEELRAQQEKIAEIESVINATQRDLATVESCAWTQDSDGIWNTYCDYVFVLDEGAPSENSMVFCCFCGKPIQEQSFDEE